MKNLLILSLLGLVTISGALLFRISTGEQTIRELKMQLEAKPLVVERVIEVERIVAIPVEVIREVAIETRGYNNVEVPVYIDREVVKIVGAAATQEELDYVYQMIEVGIFSHQFYAMNPALQTAVTGGTELNWEWVRKYKAAKALIDRAYIAPAE